MPRNTHNPLLGVALTKCYFCQEDYQIVLNTRLTEHYAAKVDSMHGMIIDMNPCPQCKEFMKQGIIVITIDEKKSEPNWDKAKMPNPWRTGGWFVVTENVVNMIAKPQLAELIRRHRFMFMEHEVAEQIGLFEQAEKQRAHPNEN